MPFDLRTALAPERTAVLAMELQEGVIGEGARFPELAAAAERAGLRANAARVLGAARAAGVPVVHCTAAFRADRRGSHTGNSPFIRRLLRDPGHMLEGTPAAEVLGGLRDPGDLESRRHHGFSPFTGTGLDTALRAMGTGTVVALGLSVNLGVLGLALEAVNLGYRVVVAEDAVAGVPEEYARAVMENTIALLAARAPAEDIAAAWAG
ncbi:cysteine hydrolase [Nocardiopsis sp. CNT-189]|uniref:cysteine hydrolase n=1 Tax=Nocardiopsis oceanisediminis TaxID=2816862 RepID=UPI003B3836E6